MDDLRLRKCHSSWAGREMAGVAWSWAPRVRGAAVSDRVARRVELTRGAVSAAYIVDTSRVEDGVSGKGKRAFGRSGRREFARSSPSAEIHDIRRVTSGGGNVRIGVAVEIAKRESIHRTPPISKADLHKLPVRSHR